MSDVRSTLFGVFQGVSLKFMKIKPLYTCDLDIRSARKIASEFVDKK